jgi:hypothetical protein
MVQSACLCMSRLISNCTASAEKMERLTAHDLLPKLLLRECGCLCAYMCTLLTLVLF